MSPTTLPTVTENTPTPAAQTPDQTPDTAQATHEAVQALESHPPVPAWALHRRLYNWTLRLSETRHATWALFGISFAESSFFPIPPDVLLAPLCIGNRKKAFWFAAVTTLASVMGAVLGYIIGAHFWDATASFWFNSIPGFSEDKFGKVESWYESWGVLILFVAAFTPVPYKIFTIVGGVMGQALLPFIAVSIVGRGARFFLVAALFWWIGPKAEPYIDKYFNWLCLAFVLLAVAGFAALKLMH